MPLRRFFAPVYSGRRVVCSYGELKVYQDQLEEEGLPTARLFPIPGYLDP